MVTAIACDGLPLPTPFPTPVGHNTGFSSFLLFFFFSAKSRAGGRARGGLVMASTPITVTASPGLRRNPGVDNRLAQ